MASEKRKGEDNTRIEETPRSYHCSLITKAETTTMCHNLIASLLETLRIHLSSGTSNPLATAFNS